MPHADGTTVTSTSFFDRYRPKGADDMPKYQQIRFAIGEAIRTGFWGEGDKLPTEEELVSITGFSLGTVQRAVRMLSEDGFLARRQGSGTFVTHSHSRISEPWHFQFLDEDGSSVLPAYPTVVARERTQQRGPWSRFLQAGNEALLRIDRHINVNDEFNAFSRFFVAGAHADLMEGFPVEQLHGANFRIVLTQASRLPVQRIDHNVSLMPVNRPLADQLGLAVGEQVMRVEIMVTAADNNRLYFQELFCPPSMRKLSLSSVGRF